MLNEIVYELKPVVWTLVAMTGTKASHGSHSTLFFALILLAATGMIVHARLVHRGYIKKQI